MVKRDHSDLNKSKKNYKMTLFDMESNNVGLLELSGFPISLEDYDINKYIKNVNEMGLEKTWANILLYVTNYGFNEFLNLNNFGNLYEVGLTEQDKKIKKQFGQYYTPLDVSKLMGTWLHELEGFNVCDVGCGTGNLINSYLSLLNKSDVKKLLDENRIYLYDFDKTAITIAQYSIALKYGIQYLNNINIICGDFLSNEIQLPPYAKVISNPPYAKFEKVSKSWNNTKIQTQTKEFYASFMEKIIESKSPSVIITPYSFLGGSKFQDLRNLLTNYNGFIVAFDNVPGNIFNGRKHGIFNTNTANSVRAAITVVKKYDKIKGFRTTQLIRFKNVERTLLLDSRILETQLSKKNQLISLKNKVFAKVHIELEDCFDSWQLKSKCTLEDVVSKSENQYKIYMPNTCRYFTTASTKKLNRGGYISISVENEHIFYYLYCLINSSFVYWWWRIYDGGITYPVGLFNSIPIFYDLLSINDKDFFCKVALEMISNEENYTVTKMNAGKIQENIKFPKKYRDILNERFLKILSSDIDISKFDLIHQNTFFSGLANTHEDE